MYFLYSALLAVLLLLLSPYFLFQGLRHQKYLHSLAQRLGWLPQSLRQLAPGAIWVHAVSVGEVLAVVPLLRQLKQRFPNRPLVLTTVTRTGQQVATRQAGLVDAVFYFPLDFAFAARRGLACLRPALVVIAETEVWPSFLREAEQAGVPVAFVNGRISDRSFRRHRQVPLWRRFLGRALATPRFFLMQTQQDAERIIALGAPAERVAVGGNLKFDIALPARPAFLDWLESRVPVIVGGSTMEGEEEILVDCLRGLKHLFPKALLVLAPRHPERFEPVARWLESHGVRFVRRSAWGVTPPSELAGPDGSGPDVLLLDTLGELAGTYAAATVAFVGGSLVPAGGHNPVEPGLWGKPILFGPFMENFRLVAQTFAKAGAALEVRDAAELRARLTELLGDGERRQAMGRAARALIESNRGATLRAIETMAQLLPARG